MAVKCPVEIEQAVKGVLYIADKTKSEDDDQGVSAGLAFSQIC